MSLVLSHQSLYQSQSTSLPNTNTNTNTNTKTKTNTTTILIDCAACSLVYLLHPHHGHSCLALMATTFVRLIIEGPVTVSASATEHEGHKQPRRSLLQVRRDASFAAVLHCILLRLQLAPPVRCHDGSGAQEHTTAAATAAAAAVDDDEIVHEFMTRERLALYRVDAKSASSRATLIEPSSDRSTYLVDGALLRLELHDPTPLRHRFQQRQDDARLWIEASKQRRERLANELMNFSAVPREMKHLIWPADSQPQPVDASGTSLPPPPPVFEWSAALERGIKERRSETDESVAAMLDQWRRRSYVVVALDDATMAAIDEAQQRASRFFDVARTLERKTLERLSNSRAFRGFHERALFHKRFVMVRRWCEQVWQLNNLDSAAIDDANNDTNATLHEMQRLLEEMRHAAELAFDAMASIAECFTRVAARSVGLPEREIDALFERHYRECHDHDDGDADDDEAPLKRPQLDLEAQEPFSMSNLTFFHYDVPEGHEQQVRPNTQRSRLTSMMRCLLTYSLVCVGVCVYVQSVHCPMHSDVSLVTLIPRSRGVSGLFVYDWLLDKWIDFESNAPRNYAVLMGGESLARLSNHIFLPGMHEVSHVNGSRKSMPLQLLARREAMFDHDRLDAAIVGEWKADDGIPRCVSAGAFVEYTSSRRVSSNFPPSEARTPILQR